MITSLPDTQKLVVTIEVSAKILVRWVETSIAQEYLKCQKKSVSLWLISISARLR